MTKSGLIHAHLSYLNGDMIFFFAFGAVLEILSGNGLLYLAIMVSITVVSALAYPLLTVVFESAIPRSDNQMSSSSWVLRVLGKTFWACR